MSHEAEWVIERMPEEAELVEHVQVICAAARLDAPAVTRDALGLVELRFIVPTEGAADVPVRLGLTSRSRDEILADLDPPRAPPAYRLLVELIPPDEDDDVPPVVRVGSETDDNRAGWPVACDLGLALATRCGIVNEEEEEEGFGPN